jgi:hypothetical protein
LKLKIFHIPALSSESAISDLNRFLAGNQVAEVQKHFVPDGPNSFWSVWVSVVQQQQHESGFKPGKDKVDYKEVLSETDFALYAQLRELRKQMAEFYLTRSCSSCEPWRFLRWQRTPRCPARQ